MTYIELRQIQVLLEHLLWISHDPDFKTLVSDSLRVVNRDIKLKTMDPRK